MEISNRRISLMHQISFSLGFNEILSPGERNGSVPQETPFAQSLLSGINPNPDSDKISNKEKIEPITPSKSEVHFANKTLETNSITNEEKTLNGDQKPTNNKPRKKKYKPKVVREDSMKGIKTQNLKSGNWNPCFSPQNPEFPMFKAPKTPDPKSGNSNPGHEYPEVKFDNSKVSISPDPNPKTSIDMPVTPNPTSENLKNTIIIDPITPNPKFVDSNDSIVQDLTKSESKLDNLKDIIIRDIKKDIVYFSKTKRNLNTANEKEDISITNEEQRVNLDKNTAFNCDDITVPVQKMVRRRLDFENEGKTGTESGKKQNVSLIGTSSNFEDVLHEASIGAMSDETLNKSLIGAGSNCEDLIKNSSIGTESDKTLNESMVCTDPNCEDAIKEVVVTESYGTLNKSSIGTTLICEDVIKEASVGTQSDPNLMIKSTSTVPNCENVIKPIRETEPVEILDRDFDRLALMKNLRALAIKKFLQVKLKNKQMVPNPKPKPELSSKKLMNEIILKMKNLNLNSDHYAIVPFEAKKLRAKVVLSEETIKEWQIITGSASSPGGANSEKEEYWRAERGIFENLVHGFIYKMKLIQGDRKFSGWNGSVLDSVVGVFLTQNVSDHMSSSAFISLASRFPPKKENGNTSTWPDKKFADIEWERAKSTSELETTSKIDNNNNNNNDDININNNKEKKVPKVGKKGYRAGMETIDWDELRRCVLQSRYRKERKNININIDDNINNNVKRKDSVDWDAVRNSDVKEVSKAIHDRGMDNLLAERIQDFLNRVANDHGSVDLEWLREIPEEKAKEFLSSIYGLGLKSVECVRLLSLHHVAFPVDTNVGRICVRLGWVPLEPLPESVQMHLLELYPVMDSIQKYLWPRLCKLDQKTLYELHYQMITFGKVFCTKSKPNCNSCPLRSECKHFASAFASARLALPESNTCPIIKSRNPFSFSTNSSEIRLAKTGNPIPILPKSSSESGNPIPILPKSSSESRNPIPILPKSSSESGNPIPILPKSSSESRNPIPILPKSSSEEGNPIPILPSSSSENGNLIPILPNSSKTGNSIPILPNLSSKTGNPIPCYTSSSSSPIIEEPSTPPTEQNQETLTDIEDLFSSDSEEIPTIKLDMNSFMRNVEKLVRESEREVVRIEDISRALVVLPPVQASIPVPKLRNPGRLRTVHDAYELPDSHAILKWMDFEKRVPDDPCPYLLILWDSDKENTSGSCVTLSEEERNEYVLGSILIPCRTAMRGSFPLNGTYFQVNEVFADHHTARNPIRVLRDEIWRLRRLPCYFGTSVSTVLKGLPTDTIQFCFWKGFICVREFDRATRSPRPLSRWLHYNPSRVKKDVINKAA